MDNMSGVSADTRTEKAMEYSIGEVSSILNLSKDMVRYYEKQGAIRASRNPENNYRTYETMEVFWLLEALHYKSWGIPISEIAEIRKNRYDHNTGTFLSRKIEELKDEISYKYLLKGRLENIRDQFPLARINVGNFWVRRTPAVWSCHLVTGRGDVYDRISLSARESRVIFDEKCIPFFDNGLTVYEDRIDWEMIIRKEYTDALQITVPESFTYIPEATVLCTNVDIGRSGSLIRQFLKFFLLMRVPEDIRSGKMFPCAEAFSGEGMMTEGFIGSSDSIFQSTDKSCK